MGDVSKAGWLNKLFIWRVVDFFASSLDTVGLAPGFGCDWNKRAVRNRDSNHIKIKRVEKEQEVFRASALKTAEKVLQENLHLVTGTVRIRSFTLFLQVFPSLTGSRPLLHRLSHCNIRTGNTGCCKTFCWAGCYWCSVSTEIYSTYGGGWACCERMLSELHQVVCA